MIAQRFTDLKCTAHRLFRVAKKKQNHPVAGGKTNQFFVCFRVPERVCPADDAIELLHQLDLLVDQQLRVTYHVDEQQMRDLESDLRPFGTI